MKSGAIFLLFTLFFWLGLSSKSHAFIYFNDGVFPELATSGRALAMGNAFLSKVDDSMSVWYNPAGLGTVRYPHFHLSNIHMETNKDWIRMGTGGSLTDGASNFSKSFQLNGTRQLLLENRNKVSYSRFHIMPNFTSRFFSLGYLYSNRTKATIGGETDAKFEFAKRTDHGPYFGFNFSLFGGIFKFGASAIYLMRKEVYGEEDRDKTVDIGGPTYTADWRKGNMFDITAGTRLTLPVFWLPTFSAKLNNAAGRKFSKTGALAPLTIKQSLDVGFSLTPQIGKIVRVHMEVNYRDLTKKYPSEIGAERAVTSARRLGAGLEFDFARIFFIRFGYGDGYGSAGLGLRAPKLEFDLTTYAVDTTSSEFRGKEDRRFSMTISSGF